MPPGAGRVRFVMNCWPPFLGAGIRIVALSDDFRFAKVRLKRYWFNPNWFGTHFGGSLFAMTDPFWAILIAQNLGADHLVWDRAAEIDFRVATREPVSVEFRLDAAVIDALRAAAAGGDKVLRWFDCAVVTSDGTVVAHVRKQVYVRRKRDAA